MSGEVRLSPEATAVIDGGIRDVPDALLGGPRSEAGSLLRLARPEGAPLAIAVSDPGNACIRVMATADEGASDVTPEFWRTRVARALGLRRALGLATPDSAFRLLHGAGDGTPGFLADVFGDWAVLYAPSDGLMAMGRELAEAVCAEARLRGAVLKARGRGAARAGRVQQAWLGERTPERLTVRERGVPFEVHLDAGINVGLFTDMREHRHGLARWVRGGSVLNLFAYTGSLSVIAARAGAQVTSVDLSAGVLDWARDNFRHAGLDPDRHVFVAEDAGRYLNQAIGEGRQFDAVLVDPPSFSAARDAEFAVERDYPGLVARAARLVAPGGLLWLASNTRGVSLAGLARDGLRRVRREAGVIESGGLPPDHPTLLAQPEDRYLQVELLRLG